MKFLVKILFIFSIILFSCTTPEQKIIKSFENGKVHKFNKEIKSAEIYDTIYTKSIIDSLPFFENKIDIIRKKVDAISNYKDSIIKLNYSNSLKHLLIIEELSRKESYERDIDHLFRQQEFYYAFYNTYDSICGYFAKIYTEKDTFDVVVRAKNYSVICPTFMFKNTHPSRHKKL